jgi:hypothetical protein
MKGPFRREDTTLIVIPQMDTFVKSNWRRDFLNDYKFDVILADMFKVVCDTLKSFLTIFRGENSPSNKRTFEGFQFHGNYK